MNHQKKFLSVLLIGAIALVVEFGFHQPNIARIIVTVVGAIFG